jgi:hypothetical protein
MQRRGAAHLNGRPAIVEQKGTTTQYQVDGGRGRKAAVFRSQAEFDLLCTCHRTACGCRPCGWACRTGAVTWTPFATRFGVSPSVTTTVPLAMGKPLLVPPRPCAG